MMTDFVMIEMSFHAKALEVYSQCIQDLNGVSVDQDIKVSITMVIDNKYKHKFNCRLNLSKL